ncbi:hypothetical protein NDU88_000716 [Pleurodeles waltl]|uniref:Uncharacterized protein n=1 Tax=Pleurodeles waltl TaxID=8319 RepID=A0AAV7KNF0_PLEWA|nr:hypothetical protein NDU88_000716 [Pleurodeles waltl]
MSCPSKGEHLNNRYISGQRRGRGQATEHSGRELGELCVPPGLSGIKRGPAVPNWWGLYTAVTLRIAAIPGASSWRQRGRQRAGSTACRVLVTGGSVLVAACDQALGGPSVGACLRGVPGGPAPP